MPNLLGSVALFTSNILVCTALILLRHSADNSSTRAFYLLAANCVAGLLGFFPFRNENSFRFDRPTLAVIVWSACYCAEYGIFLVYPGIISLSQLIICNCLAPFVAIYVSQDVQRTALSGVSKLLSTAPILFLIGISYLERTNGNRSDAFAWLILLLVFLSVVISQSCARYVARNRAPSWSQPRLTMLNAIFLFLVLSVAIHHSNSVLQHSIRIRLCFFVGVMILLIQRLYVYGLKKADPFISAMTLGTMVPLSLGVEFIFEHRRVGLAEIALATGYVFSNLVSFRMTSLNQPRTILN